VIAPAPSPPPAYVCAQASTDGSPAALTAGPRDGHSGFTIHLIDAIGVNVRRARLYARQSQGRSWSLTIRLIAAEAVLIPTAWAFDLWGGAFYSQGLPAVTGDFVSMRALPAGDRPLGSFQNPPAHVWRDLEADVTFYGDVIRTATVATDFRLVCQACEALLDSIDRLRSAYGLPLPMTRHVVESLGYGAVHALAFAKRANGATDGLYSQFLGLQAMGIAAGVAIDRDALPVHADGIGILVNDLPHIPFREEWQAIR
jgi:hypothetical protein